MHSLCHAGKAVGIETGLFSGVGFSRRHERIGTAGTEKRDFHRYLVDWRFTAFYQQVKETAKANHTRVYLVSGATGGFDVLRTASLMGNASARFFNEKGPNALKGTAVYDETLQTEQRTVFSGTATEAIELFPTKVNVTVAASLASVGPDQMQVTMQSTPGFVGDTQRVEIKNEQVRAVVDVYSATSEIAGWSVVNTLINITSPIVF